MNAARSSWHLSEITPPAGGPSGGAVLRRRKSMNYAPCAQPKTPRGR